MSYEKSSPLVSLEAKNETIKRTKTILPNNVKGHIKFLSNTMYFPKFPLPKMKIIIYLKLMCTVLSLRYKGFFFLGNACI